MKRIFFILLSACLLIGCAEESIQPPSLILEGWIEADGYPVVLIHKSYVLDAAKDSSQTLEEIAEQQLIPFGKVTVSDGENEVILTGRLDTAYMPPYTYSSLDMVGQVGKTYTVTAKYRSFYATATTTIPPIAYLDSVVVHSSVNDKVNIRAFMSGIDPNKNTYYALFVKQIDDKQYQLCPFGVFESKDATDGQLEITIFNPFPNPDKPRLSHYFFNDTTKSVQQREYDLKLATIDYASYQFWKAYNELIITQGILFVPVYKNIPSNIEGGYGYFSGMSSSFYHFNLSRTTTYRYSHP